MSYRTRMNIQSLSMKVKLEQAQSSLIRSAISCNGIEGKRRKFIVAKTNETNSVQQANAATTDGSVVFKILNQPETQHRARYQTEGSRGAIKDRSGIAYPTVKLDGYRKPTKIQIYIGNDSGKVMPHMFYQVCKVTGKNSNPCDEKKIDGTDIIEISSEPHNDMTIICDCVGILKERFADVEARFPKHKTWKNSKKKSTKCRLVFRAVVENRNGQQETLQVVSDVINCTQLPGTPEILKMSTASSFMEGGGELWIIGKNFLKDTKVVFSHSIVGKKEPLWTKFLEPLQEYFHQTHLITQIPPFFDPNISEDVEISVFIKCGDKLSDPVPFTYKGKPVHFTYTPSLTNSHDANLPRGVAAPAVAINQQFAETGSVSVIKCNDTINPVDCLPQPRPTILEPLHSHKNKKTKIDFTGKNIRRTRSVPRPNLINEDTILVSDRSKSLGSSWKQSLGSPWRGISKASEFHRNVNLVQSQNIAEPIKDAIHVYKTALTHLDVVGSAKRSFSFDDESNSCNFTKDSLMDDNSISSSKPNFSSSLTNDFSNVFSFKRNQLCETGTTLSFSKPMYHKPAELEPTTFHQTDQTIVVPCDPTPWKTEPVYEIKPDNPVCTGNGRENEDDKDVPNVSYEATSDDKATISISLPTSILKDQKHFQSVIDTINNTLLKQNIASDDEDKVTNEKERTSSPEVYNGNPAPIYFQSHNNDLWMNEESPVQSNHWSKSQSQNMHIYPSDEGQVERKGNISPTQHITSMPVSVLSKTRKRTFTGEGAENTDFETNFPNSDNVGANNQGFDGESILPNLTIYNQNNATSNEGSHAPIAIVQSKNDEYMYPKNEKTAEYTSNFINSQSEQISNSKIDNSYNTSTEIQWQQKEQTVAQEKKWNAEFNEMLQTVIEEEKDNKITPMDWANKGEASNKEAMEWKPENRQEQSNMQETLDWSTNTKAVSFQVNFQEESSSVVPSYLVEPVTATEVREALDIIQTFQTDLGGTAPAPNQSYSTSPGLNFSGNHPAIEGIEVKHKEKNSTESLNSVLRTNLKHSSVITPMPTTSQKAHIRHSSEKDSARSPTGFLTSVQHGNNDNATTSTLEQYPKKSPQEKQETEPEIQHFNETLMTIQGDPFLSESSSVIGVQKDLENASVETPEKVTINVYKHQTQIPKDQEWTIMGTQANEWAFTSGS
eukprot:GFUD01001047.1.p1 GENE.GFUD01001047.1~~GFUD01001047.1.p1  ORF type:complete len:1175 (-),score=239.54 GFUD01001047.1:671-4195(-)